MNKVKIPANVKAEIKKSILGFLHDKEEAFEYTIKKDISAQTNGSCTRDGKFISCSLGRVELKAGTKGYLFISEEKFYSEYVTVLGWTLPKKDSGVLKIRKYYQFVTLVTLESGDVVLADHMETVETYF